jgi:3-oxoadipate enol-lactonase
MQQTTVNGVRITYLDEGQGDVIIFLHGLGVSSRDWDGQIDYFRDHWRVIAPDFRGHGASDKPDSHYDISIHANDVLGLMDQLDIDRAHLVGLSMAPQRLKSMTIINSGPALPDKTFAAKKMLWTRVLSIHLLGMHRYAHKVAQSMFPGEGKEALIDIFTRQIASNPKKVYLKNLKSLFGWGVLEHLADIEVPTLMLTGDRDYSPVAVKQAVVDAMKNAKLVVISDTGHGTPIEKPGETNEAIAHFIEAV